MAKAYKHLRGKVEAFAEEPKYQELVDAKKLEVLGTLDGEEANVNRLAFMVVKYEREKKSLYAKYGSKETTDTEYEINLFRKALSQLFRDACIEQGVEEVRLSTGELVTLDDNAILTVKDKEVSKEWALANVPELLTISYKGLNRKQIEKLAEWGAKHNLSIEVTLNAQTLKALGADNVKQGKPVPAGMSRFLDTKAKVYGLNKGGSDAE